MTSQTDYTLIWHIDRAKFVFADSEEYETWKKEPKVYFEMNPSASDDMGAAVFDDADEAEGDFEITEDRGTVSMTLEDDGPVITAWVKVKADLVEDLDEDTLSTWSNEEGGWASSSIHLGEYDATIDSDDGGDWRFPTEA